MTDKEQIIIDGVDVSKCKDYHPKNRFTCHPYICNCHQKPNCYFKQLARKTQECGELKAYAQRQENQREEYYKEYLKLSQQYEALKAESFTREELIGIQEEEIEELKDKMADVIYTATGGRLSYSNYTLDAIEQAFNDQLEILSDQKVEEEIKELNQKLYLVQNEVHFKTEYIQEQREEIKQLEQKNEELEKKLELIPCVDTVLQIGYEAYKKQTKYLLNKNSRYRKALDEIEKVCLEDTYTFADGTQIRYDSLDDILNIINKAKGKE